MIKDIINNIDNLSLREGFGKKLAIDIRYLYENNYLDLIQSIYLFGSCSKGRETYKSDIDLGIITKKELPRRIKADIRGELSDPSMNGIETNVVFIVNNNLDADVRLHAEILEGIQLYGEENNGD